MRPVKLQIPNPSRYKESDQLDRIVGQQSTSSDGQGDSPQARTLSVKEYVEEAQRLLDMHWVATGYAWDDAAKQQQFELNLESIGGGWREAARELISQVGPFCAFCEVPLGFSLTVTHLLSPRRFVSEAFDFSKLLPVCQVCAAVKADQPDQAMLGQDTAASIASILDSRNFAWPSRYWSSLGDKAVLPYRYDLFVVQRSAEQLQTIHLILPAEYAELSAAWREGRLVEREGLFEWTREEQPTVTVAALISASDTDSHIQAGVQAVIELVKLNQIVSGAGIPGLTMDRRVAQRTSAFMDALAEKDYLQFMLLNPGNVPIDTFRQNLIPTMVNTGFWGVWRTVLSDVPGIDECLSSAFPGLPATQWVI